MHSKSILFGHIFPALLGLYIFSRGFLIIRKTVSQKSSCENPPISPLFTKQSECWMPSPSGRKKPRIVLLLIDALRLDMVIPDAADQSTFRNKLNVLYEVYKAKPRQAALFRFLADPPTATTQRLQGLVAGTLPTFVEIGDTFSESTCNLDNWMWQLLHCPLSRYPNLHFYGDDTWTHLFPFMKDRSRGTVDGYLSFHLFDLHTVDTRIKKALFPLMESKDYDMLIGHFLGHDHCGHKYGPMHGECGEKLKEMDGVIRAAMDRLEKDEILVVMGDHGMTDDGDHGGVSPKEVSSVLFFYTNTAADIDMSKELRDRINESRDRYLGVSDLQFFPKTDYIPSVNQIDFVPTFSLLTGIPIPYGNLGAVIPEALCSLQNADLSYLVDSIRMNAYQVKRYLKEGVGSQEPGFDKMDEYWTRLDKIDASASADSFLEYYGWLQDVLTHCKHVWANFDSRLMNAGILLAFICVFSLFSNSGNPVASVTALLHSALMTTTSFIVFEDDVLRFSISSLLMLDKMALSDRLWALVIVRLTKYIGGCREEQFPFCQTLHHRNTSWLATALLTATLGAITFKSSKHRFLLLMVYAWWMGWWATDRSLIPETTIGSWIAAWVPRIILVYTGYAVYSDSVGNRFNTLMIGLSCVQRPLNGMALLGSLSFYDCIFQHPQAELLATMFGQLLFYVTGHQTTLSSLQWETSFVGYPHLSQPIQAGLMAVNTLLGPVSGTLWLLLSARKHNKTVSNFVPVGYQLAMATGCALACKQLLRHLMIWKIFAPRLIFQVLIVLSTTVLNGVF